jgi:hypothetical protein
MLEREKVVPEYRILAKKIVENLWKLAKKTRNYAIFFIHSACG